MGCASQTRADIGSIGGVRVNVMNFYDLCSSSFKAKYATYGIIITRIVNFLLIIIFIQVDLVLEGLFVAYLLSGVLLLIFEHNYKFPKKSVDETAVNITLKEIFSAATKFIK